MKSQIFVFIILVLLGLTHCYDKNYCLNEGLQNNDCGWYINCLEDAYMCGPKGYPVGYGYKYCSRFVEKFNKFSPAGQKWIDGTLTCLKQSLKDALIHSDSMTCADVNKIAFNSHPKCYVENGFCELFTKQDIQEIYQTLVSLLQVYQVKDFLSIQSIKQVITVAFDCLQKKI
ncbi:hypothetical protein ABPG74_002871 [Tetrahymena malaccensis]